jgi:phage gp29-like protein
MLYDAWGNEIKTQKNPEGKRVATASIRDRWSSYPSNGLKPETLATIFKEADQGYVWRQAELFEEIEEKDTHLGSVLQTRRLAVTGLDFEVEPYSEEDKRDVEIAEFVQEAINDLPDFEDNLSDILDAIGKGYSVLELLWGYKGGKHIVEYMEFVHPKRITWYDTLKPRITTEENLWKGVEIPAFKTIFHVHKTRSGHKNRQGVLRTCAWMYLFKNYCIKDWLVFAEIYGMPLRVGKYRSYGQKSERNHANAQRMSVKRWAI